MTRTLNTTSIFLILALIGAALCWMAVAPRSLPMPAVGMEPVLSFALPGIGEVRVGSHAEERHGEDAWAALRAAQACGEQCLYRCPGDKWYYMGRIGTRFFTVVGYGKSLATAFVTSRDNSKRLAEDHCVSVSQQRAGHDGMVGAY